MPTRLRGSTLVWHHADSQRKRGESVFGQLGVLMERLRDLADLVIAAAWAGAMGFGVAALVVTLVTTVGEPLGFGVRFYGWPVVSAILFIPAVVVWWFARNARMLRETITELPERLGGLAEDTITELIGVASAARSSVAERRGMVQLVTGALQLRKVTGALREAAGVAAPVTATFSPTALLVTAVAAVAGMCVLALAVILATARVLL